MITALLILVSMILIGYAASCNAKMDVVTFRYNISIYTTDSEKYDDQWFNPILSWSNRNVSQWNKYTSLLKRYVRLPLVWFVIHVYRKAWSPVLDYWHWNKTKMICSLALACSLLYIAGSRMDTGTTALELAIALGYYAGYGIVWNATFDYYYDRKLLKGPFKKKWLWLK
jgi:hypothetical protein